MARSVDRRTFLTKGGTAAIGIAVFGIAAASCSKNEIAAVPSTASSVITATTVTAATTTTTQIASEASSTRVLLGNVSAYIVERGDGLVIIDTGNPGSAPAIEAALGEYGRSWSDVGYVVATHKHGDHVGSLNDILAAASSADAFAGQLDIPSISSDRPLTPLFDGDMVNGIRVITTPGHTTGHISLLDPSIGLFAGDALNGADGTVVGPNPKYTPDMDTAWTSVGTLATFSYEQAFFGHGDPVLSGASAEVKGLAESL